VYSKAEGNRKAMLFGFGSLSGLLSAVGERMNLMTGRWLRAICGNQA